MTNGVGGVAVAPQAFSDDDVLQASFHLEAATEGTEHARKLFLRTYTLANAQDRIWHAMPEEDWPLLATILPNSIIMRPIHINPYAQRYLKPKNGRFTKVIYVDDYGAELPNDAEAAASRIDSRLAWRLFDPAENGLGLNRDLDPVWQGLSRIQHAEVLVISQHPEMHAKDGVVSISVDEVDKLRRTFNRVTTNGRKLIRQTKLGIVHDEMLTRLDPERFQRVMQVNQTLVEVQREGTKQAAARERAERRTNVQVVRKQLSSLVTEAPQELMILHAEIERVTLVKMIEAFKAKLASKLTEPHWQTFFEQNKFVLSLVFARPVELTHTQFHAKGSTLTGAGAQIGDFLFKEYGQALAIVEIKTPETALLQDAAYRGQEVVFGPNSKLSGAVTQVLFQQSELRKRWMTHVQDNPTLRMSDADVIKCVVVAGRLPTDPAKLRSFEVFRNACKDVDIVTFDELLAKLEFLEKQLAPKPELDLF
ncbi:Shedu immune nuclease family protein [Pseudomonas sp. NPDC098740]|uniref:Shedu immune nuclease family protein n=1 Tax=Pseudomonas sp. NPDC098740 TaxID=3364486 RepID=UPI00383A2E57